MGLDGIGFVRGGVLSKLASHTDLDEGLYSPPKELVTPPAATQSGTQAASWTRRRSRADRITPLRPDGRVPTTAVQIEDGPGRSWRQTKRRLAVRYGASV